MFENLFHPATLIAKMIILLVALPVHELAHAVSADYFGDDTPRLQGRLTLNPLAHLDVMGSLMILVAGFGWAKPVQINPYRLMRRSPSAVMWVSLAGPASNLLLAVLAAIFVRVARNTPIMTPLVGQILVVFIFINLLLFIFNLIPLAPLDGDKILGYFLPPSAQRFFEEIRPYGPIILIALLFIGPRFGLDLIGSVVQPIIDQIMRFLLGAG